LVSDGLPTVVVIRHLQVKRGAGKVAGQRLTFYHCATQPTLVIDGYSLYTVNQKNKISQGSVATRLMTGRMFNIYFIANLPVCLPVKEL